MDPFTAAIGPLITAVAGATLAWLVIRGRESAAKAQPAGAAPDSRRDRLYRRSFESSPVGLAVLTPQGQWIRVNDRLRALLGYKPDELSRLTIRDLTHSDDRKVEATHIRKLMRRDIGSYAIQKRLLCKDQKYRRFEVSMVRFEGEGEHRELWQCVVSPIAAPDTTDLLGADRKLDTILEPISDLAYVAFDDQGIIDGWNEGATRIFGYDRAEIVGKSRTMLYRDSDVWEQKPLHDLKEAAARGRLDVEDTRVGRDGVEIRLKITIIPDVRDDRVAGFMELAREVEQVRGVDQYRQAYERLKDLSEEKIQSLHAEINDLRQEVDDVRGRETTMRAELQRTRQDAQKQMGELRILTDAFRKELENRKSLEHELNEVLKERDQLGHKVIEMERHRAPLEREFVDLATPAEAHWVPVEPGQPAEALLEIALEKRSGTLVTASHEDEIRFFFDKGLLTSTSSNAPSSFLGEALLREGVIRREDHERALEIHHETGIALGRILVMSGTIDEATLAATIVTRARSDVARFVGWTDGRMMFLDGDSASVQHVRVRLDVGEVLDAVEKGEISRDLTLEPDPDDTLVVPLVAAPAPEVEAGVVPSPVGERTELPDDPAGDDTMRAAAPAFVASSAKRTTKFHRVGCLSAKKIDASRRLEFQTESEAIGRGLEPCRKCIG